MKRLLTAGVVCLGGGLTLAQGSSPQMAGVEARPAAAFQESYGKLPLSFEANQGQVDKRVRFVSRGSGYSLFLTDQEAVLALSKGGAKRAALPGVTAGRSAAKDPVKSDVVRMQLDGAAAATRVTGEEKLPGTANYFLGNDPAKWHTSLPTYSKVKYKGVYPGVDLIYYGNQGQLEYDFVVAAGGDPGRVRLHFAGAEKLKVNADGDLRVVAKNGEIAFHRPVVYQAAVGKQAGEAASERTLVKGRFVLLARNVVGFSLGAYDRGRELVIDPTLAYSTYLGGSGFLQQGSDCCGDYGTAIAADSAGDAYVAGYTGSANFPTVSGSYQRENKAVYSTAFIAKINSTGTALIYSTYLGGTNESDYGVRSQDFARAIVISPSGRAYVTGYTTSTNFPVTSNAYQRMNNGTYGKFAENYTSNAFVSQLSSDGSELVYSTYLGGTGSGTSGDSATGIALDPQGHAYITGTAFSDNFPLSTNPYQPVNRAKAIGGSNVFVTKLDTEGSDLLYSTYLGGSGVDEPNSGVVAADFGGPIAVDGLGAVYVAGYTYSTDFPLSSGAYQSSNRGCCCKVEMSQVVQS